MESLFLNLPTISYHKLESTISYSFVQFRIVFHFLRKAMASARTNLV